MSLLAVHTQTEGRTLFFTKQFISKMFLHFSPTVAGRSRVPMKRETGKGSACSSLLGVQELVIIRAATTQSIIQLHVFYCLVIIIIYYTFHNKHCNQYGLVLILFKYTVQAICTIPA